MTQLRCYSRSYRGMITEKATTLALSDQAASLPMHPATSPIIPTTLGATSSLITSPSTKTATPHPSQKSERFTTTNPTPTLHAPLMEPRATNPVTPPILSLKSRLTKFQSTPSPRAQQRCLCRLGMPQQLFSRSRPQGQTILPSHSMAERGLLP